MNQYSNIFLLIFFNVTTVITVFLCCCNNLHIMYVCIDNNATLLLTVYRRPRGWAEEVALSVGIFIVVSFFLFFWFYEAVCMYDAY